MSVNVTAETFPSIAETSRNVQMPLLASTRTEPDTLPESTERSEPPGIMSILCLVALKRRLWLLPILTSSWLFSSFWISYGIAVGYNHTEADFPYISHTAIEAPERCVFGQLVNIGAVMLAMNVILRYLYLKRYFLCKQVTVTDRCFKVNLAGLVLGFASAFGLSMVANFQTEVQRIPHYIGAFFAFGIGTVYCWIQTTLSYKVRCLMTGDKLSDQKFRKMALVILQFINSVVMTVLLVLFSTSKAIYKVQSTKGLGSKWDTLREIYLTSTVSEWLLAFSILTFTLTFAPNFKNVRMHDPHIHLEEEYEKKHSISRHDDISANNNSNGAIPYGTADNAV
ncbi:DNA damage-regulated autophagy modulator protein 2-like isoform X2 [Dreissena polymorpha]|uniref:DNA damage-regulated autophagy modulator protein 2-like isoform X2 n=1 Tax=Dreissena polymorpha TaxID=45954 RepID=UPI0022655DF9|nr:DNA damage-regulated autophagy modulator protein 2-like isoform X2 [Dreissena polymorpha]